MSQDISNQAMAALMTALVLFLCITILVPSTRLDRPVRTLIFLGLTLGLALLTKVSALFLIPLVISAVAWGLFKKSWKTRRIISATALVLGTSFLVAGWFYIRNAVVFGKPFVTNWGPESGFLWWQWPGFRTPGHLLGFGEALVRPKFSGAYHFWDSIYSTFWLDGQLSGGAPPPWNYDWMISGAWLGLIPTFLIILGAAIIFTRPSDNKVEAGFFSIGAILIYFGAILVFAITTPYYSTGKAFYGLGLLPCFGVLAGFGVAPLFRHPWCRAVTWGLLSCWATASYPAYFVVS